jgi:hypothetical protein
MRDQETIFNLYHRHSHIKTLPLVLPHFRLVQERAHHLTKTASACALCFASNQFLSNSWFSVQSSLTWSNSSTTKASTLPNGAYSWVAALVMVMKQSENRAGN